MHWAVPTETIDRYSIFIHNILESCDEVMPENLQCNSVQQNHIIYIITEKQKIKIKNNTIVLLQIFFLKWH